MTLAWEKDADGVWKAAPPGGSGIPQGGPLTENLDAGGFAITNLGSRNVGQTQLYFNGLAVNNTSVPVPFVFGDGDATMIDLTTPTTPLPVAAGIYAYTLIVGQDGGGTGGPFFATLVVDDDYYSIAAMAGHEGQAVGAGASGAVVSLAVTWFSTAGSPFHAAIASAVADTFHGDLYVQRF